MSAIMAAPRRRRAPSYERCEERLLAQVALVDNMIGSPATGWERLAEQVGPALVRTLRARLLDGGHGSA